MSFTVMSHVLRTGPGTQQALNECPYLMSCGQPVSGREQRALFGEGRSKPFSSQEASPIRPRTFRGTADPIFGQSPIFPGD